VHALLAQAAFVELSAGARANGTTATVPHASNANRVAARLAEEVAALA
jgi:hypothetical protein